MEKLLKPYDKEYMKMAMLKHEETFKQQKKLIRRTMIKLQVYELHRLYRIQKILMKGIGHSRSRTGLDLELPAGDHIAGTDDEGPPEIEDESQIQLTLGPTSYYRRKKSETPPPSDSGLSFSSSSTGSSQMKGADTGREDLTARKWGLNSELQGGRKHSFEVEERLKQYPPWLSQARNLNMTTKGIWS